MKKKTYEHPRLEVVVVSQSELICTSPKEFPATPQNETYEEEQETVTKGWY